MITDHWPLFGLRLLTPRLELRVPDLTELAQLADVAAAGVHDPASQPFVVPWTDGTPAEVVRGRAVVGRRLRLDLQGWAAARTVQVRIEGLAPCLPMFGC